MRQISHRSEIAALCQELVRCPSLSGDEGAVAAIVEREMHVLGYDEVYRDDLGSVVGIVRGARSGRVILCDAHMDTVPATQAALWRHDPFSGCRADGRIWGRGAVDVKGSLAAALVAIGTLDRARTAGTVVMAATVGEEMIEGIALGRVLDRVSPAAVVVCEPTALGLGIGHKGRCALVVEAEGVAAHSSRPEEGINAVYRMFDALGPLRRLKPHRDSALGESVSELVEIVSAPYPGTSMVPHG